MSDPVFPDDWIDAYRNGVLIEKELDDWFNLLQHHQQQLRHQQQQDARARYFRQQQPHIHVQWHGRQPHPQGSGPFWDDSKRSCRRKEEKILSIRMPFGKYKGMPITNLPVDYLDWLLDWMDSAESNWMSNSRRRLFDELDAEFERRKTGERPTRKITPGAFTVGDEAKALLPEFVKSGYRAMALKLHPDKGGTAEQMVALKELKEALEKL